MVAVQVTNSTAAYWLHIVWKCHDSTSMASLCENGWKCGTVSKIASSLISAI